MTTPESTRPGPAASAAPSALAGGDPPPVTILYTSKYRSTERYARALAERLGATARGLKGGTRFPAEVPGPLVVLAPIYATRLRNGNTIRRALRTATGPTALCVVGMSPVDDAGRGRIAAPVAKAAPAVRVFQLRGDYDPTRLGPVHQLMMSVVRRRLAKNPTTPGAVDLLSGEPQHFVDLTALDPVVDWVRSVSE